MPFFARQKITYPHFSSSFHREQVVDDYGNVTFKKVLDNAELPPTDLFRLSRQIKAGVNQVDVSTKILGSGIAVAEAVEFVQNNSNNNDK